MKKQLLLLIMLLSATPVFLTSCSSDDDNEEVVEEVNYNKYDLSKLSTFTGKWVIDSKMKSDGTFSSVSTNDVEYYEFLADGTAYWYHSAYKTPMTYTFSNGVFKCSYDYYSWVEYINITFTHESQYRLRAVVKRSTSLTSNETTYTYLMYKN